MNIKAATFEKIAVISALSLLAIAGCKTQSRPGATERGGAYTQTAGVDQSTVTYAAEAVLSDLGYAISEVDRPSGGTHTVVGLDRQGTRYTVRVQPSTGRATVFNLRISPGANDAASIALLERIRAKAMQQEGR